MKTTTRVHQKAMSLAMQELRTKYKSEYQASYRAHVIALGGRVHPSKEEKIAQLQAELARLQGTEV